MRMTLRIAVLLIVPCLGAFQWGALADPAADFKKLVAKRDALVAALEKKPAAQEVLLRFDEAADRDDMWLTLRRADGAWRAAYAEVPGWHQSTMHEWRTYYLGNFSHGCWRPNLRFPADTGALVPDAARLNGAFDVAFRLDWPFVKRQPPGQHVQWWDKFIPGGYTVSRRMTYGIEADILPDSCLFDLVLEGGVYWDSAFAPNPKAPAGSRSVTRRPIFLRLAAPGSRFTRVTAKTPTWNAGFHEADASELKFADGKLSGALVVFLHQDGWMPWGGGKHTQHEPIVVRFEVDARLERNELTGRYTASFGGELKGKSYNPRGDDSADVVLPDTRYEGAVRGRGGRLVSGRYTARGDLDEQTGAVDGMLLDAPRPVRERVKLPDGEVTAERISTVLHQIRALHLALQCDPLPYVEAWQQTDRAEPETPDLVAYARLALQTADALPDPTAKPPSAKPETTGDSPSYAVRAADATNGVNALPDDAREWFFLPAWQVLGPFEQRLGLDHNAALAPDLVVLPAAVYRQARDRFGATVENAPTQSWQSVTCADCRLGLPGERAAMFPRYGGRTWYGAATLRSERARTVWFSVEANDFAKLWVNDRLVWTDVERAWRYRPFGRAFVPVPLEAGENRLLVRVHGDRQLSWLRLAVTAREPVTPSMPATLTATANPYIFPDAQPPLAWDLAKGVNVAWRNADLGGRTRPAIAGDAVFVTAGTGTLACVEAATGKIRWSQDLAETQPVTADKGEPPRAGEPVTDGQRIAFVSAYGTLGCYDGKGTLLWTLPAPVPQARLRLCGSRLIAECQGPRDDKKRGASATVRVLALDPETGKELWHRDLPGALGSDGQTLAAGEAAAYLTCTGAWLDPATGAPLPPFDCEMESTDKEGGVIRNVTVGPYRLHSSAGMFYLTSQARNLAVRLWARDGKLGYAHAWESNYGSSGFNNVPASGLGTDKYLFTWHSSLAHTPHCPDCRAEVDVQDARDGRWLTRLKPVMDDLYSYGALNLSTPVAAGPYLFLLGGRADNKRNQIAIVTADDRIQLVGKQDVEPGTTQSPVFAGARMFLRSPQSLLCVAATTPEGRKDQDETVARTLLRAIGREPIGPDAPDIPPAVGLRTGGKVPPGKLVNELPTEFWLGAGPFPAGSLNDAAALAALRAEAGTVFGGKPFAPLSRQHAYNEPPGYYRTSELQGTGDITPRFTARVDPQCVSGPTGAGLLYTVLDNTRDRVVIPVLNRKGVTQWLGGVPLAPEAPVHLAPGLYPYLVRVEPEFYQVEEQVILTPVNVTNALAQGALADVNWPKSWRVLGPVSVYAAPLNPAQLREVPESLVVGGHTNRLFDFTAEGNRLDLGCLVHADLGEPPDVSMPFVRPGVPLAAYAFAPVECPADGYLYVGSAFEGSVCWYVDGVSVYDRIKEGSGASATDLSAHPFAVRVTRGRHVLAVQVRPGASGWTFCSWGGFSGKTGEQLAEFRLESKIRKQEPDLRLQPCFREVPNPGTVRRMWRDRVAANAERLEAIRKSLPGTREARAAEQALAGWAQR